MNEQDFQSLCEDMLVTMGTLKHLMEREALPETKVQIALFELENLETYRKAFEDIRQKEAVVSIKEICKDEESGAGKAEA